MKNYFKKTTLLSTQLPVTDMLEQWVVQFEGQAETDSSDCPT